MHRISMLGTGLIGMFYTMALHRHRGREDPDGDRRLVPALEQTGQMHVEHQRQAVQEVRERCDDEQPARFP